MHQPCMRVVFSLYLRGVRLLLLFVVVFVIVDFYCCCLLLFLLFFGKMCVAVSIKKSIPFP